jgi:hypothetical protein
MVGVGAVSAAASAAPAVSSGVAVPPQATPIASSITIAMTSRGFGTANRCQYIMMTSGSAIRVTLSFAGGMSQIRFNAVNSALVTSFGINYHRIG